MNSLQFDYEPTEKVSLETFRAEIEKAENVGYTFKVTLAVESPTEEKHVLEVVRPLHVQIAKDANAKGSRMHIARYIHGTVGPKDPIDVQALNDFHDNLHLSVIQTNVRLQKEAEEREKATKLRRAEAELCIRREKYGIKQLPSNESVEVENDEVCCFLRMTDCSFTVTPRSRITLQHSTLFRNLRICKFTPQTAS